jgi:biotin carboxyl carrier protein
MKTIYTAVSFCLGLICLASCGSRETGQESPAPPVSVKTAPVSEGNIEDYLTLNGKTVYLKKDRIVSPVAAYVTRVSVHYGDIVKAGEVLFELQTRESRALNDTSNNLEVSAPAGGTVSDLAVNRPGTYLMEGDLLCLLVENRDLVIQVNVPYQYHELMKKGRVCRVILPDQTGFAAVIANVLPDITEPDQTQRVLLTADSPVSLPENLNLSVRFVLASHSRTLLVPREAVMTNEKQTEFWLMKLTGDSLAVRVTVEKGIGNDSLMEVFSSALHPADPVITVGGYGLPDSSIVKPSK